MLTNGSHFLTEFNIRVLTAKINSLLVAEDEGVFPTSQKWTTGNVPL